MLEAIRNAFRLPDLRQKLLVTIGILVLYRFAAHIPLPGVNREVLDSIFNSADSGIAQRNTNAHAELIAAATPARRQRADPVTHGE